MNSKQLCEALEGKTIKEVSVTREGASDSCVYAQMIFSFTDGTEFQFQFHALPRVAGLFFKNADDVPTSETVLVRP